MLEFPAEGPLDRRRTRGRAYSRGPGESVTRGDRRGRERGLGGSAPPLAGPRESDGARKRVAAQGKCTITEGQNGTSSFTVSRNANFRLNCFARAHFHRRRRHPAGQRCSGKGELRLSPLPWA